MGCGDGELVGGGWGEAIGTLPACTNHQCYSGILESTHVYWLVMSI